MREFGQNLIVFRVYMSSRVRIDNKEKYIFFLNKNLTDGLDGTTIAPDKKKLK